MDMDTRARFIVRTYLHLFGAILAFVILEAFLFFSGLAYPIAVGLLSLPWLAVLGIFMVAAWMARGLAHRTTSKPAQYLGLAFYVVAEAIIFVPLLALAEVTAGGVIQSAALVTLLSFSGLTAIAIITRKDFSFLRSVLFYGGIVAMVLIIAGVVFGFELGTFFSVAMIGLAGAAILHDTSNVLHFYPEDRYVGAALELFASVALMFWYVLRLMIALRD
ncbi:MAG: US12 family protein [Caldilineaceae bacterium]|nr:US12 family protein [Caldilineaceae bacterium]